MDLRRGLPPAMLAAMAGIVHPIVFVHLDWPDVPVFAHSSTGDIIWGRRTWRGVGDFGSITLPDESADDMAATEASVSLRAGPEELDAFLDDAIRNRDATFYYGCMTDRPGTPGSVLVSDPVAVFHGTMDAAGMSFDPVIDDEGNIGVESSITVGLATGPGARTSASVYHSDQDQARRQPGDTAGRLTALASIRAQDITWPES